ncbi:MAG: hypothetical protein AB2A00_42860 [Myxococcota bacterium]
MRAHAFLLTTALVLACQRGSAPTPDAAAPRAPTVAPAPLAFIDDDYAAALKQARERNVPIFVETWAPW